MLTIDMNVLRPHKIAIGRDLLHDCGKYIKWVHEPCSVLIITDDEVDEIYGDTVAASLEEEGFEQYRFVFASGEQSKNPDLIESVYQVMSEKEFDRTDLIVALGGGVAGDIAGFAASTYMRGIEFIQIPTTMLAMIDAAIGGKNEIITSAGRDMVGTFWMPSLVLCDVDTLDTLPDELFRDGLAEAIKYGIISGNELFSMFENGIDRDNLEDIIGKCIELKTEYVEKDVYDQHIRKMLNLGHTIGNAIEAASGYSISHGDAVASGIIAMGKIFDTPCLQRIKSTFEKCGFDMTDIDFTAEELAPYAAVDKKKGGDFVVIVIPRDIGVCELERLPLDEIETKLEKVCI